jgi:arylsulfatase A-like enzyme/tetratricopeptide (TPR) repeat protein
VKLRSPKTMLVSLAALVTVLVAGWALWHFPHLWSGAEETPVAHYPAVPGIRNVLLISIDTCRADRLSCYGYSRPSTPNIDAVAKEGVLFRQAIAPVPMTLPSHSSMMTGSYPPVHGVRTNDGYHLGEANVTLAKLLRAAGYQTAAILGGFPLDVRFGLGQGFETYDGRFGAEGGSHDRRSAEEVTGRGLAWLDEHGQKPFFLFLHYYDAHAPYQPPPPFDQQFADDLYAGGIAYVDAWIGRVIARLRERGLYDNTLVVIVGDHGESLGEHGERTHSYFAYQATLHVPLVIRAPGIGSAHAVEQTVNLVDIMPTALSVLGLERPKRVEGADLRPCLENKPWPGTPPTNYFESLQPAAFDCCPLQGVVDGRWKYIRAPRPELYDLTRDPNEHDNVVAKETATAARLRDRLETMLAAMKALAVKGGSRVDAATTKRLESLGYVGGSVARPEFDPDSEDPKDFAVVAARLDKANELKRTNHFEETRQECLAIVALRPNLVLPYILLGELANQRARPEEAVASLSKALAILTDARRKTKPLPAAVKNRQLASVRNHLGISLLMQGKAEQAESQFKAALAVDSDSAELPYDLGLVCAAQGRTDEALGYYRKALELDPQYGDAHYNLAAALAQSGHFDEACDHYRKALEIKPDDVRAHVSFADALAYHGQAMEAIAQYREALKIKPDDVDACNNLGFALANRGDLDEAMALYRKVLKIDPDYAAAHNNFGLALASRRQFDEAITHYEKALAIKPSFAEAHNNLGVALISGRGQVEMAIVHFKKAVELKPDYLGARQNLERARSMH